MFKTIYKNSLFIPVKEHILQNQSTKYSNLKSVSMQSGIAFHPLWLLVIFDGFVKVDSSACWRDFVPVIIFEISPSVSQADCQIQAT